MSESPAQLDKEQNNGQPESNVLEQQLNHVQQYDVNYQEISQSSQPFNPTQVGNQVSQQSNSEHLQKPIRFEYRFYENNVSQKAPIELDDELYQLNDSNKYFKGLLEQLFYDLEKSVQRFTIVNLTFCKTQKIIPLNLESEKDFDQQVKDLQCLQFQDSKKEFSSMLIQDLCLFIDFKDYLDIKEVNLVFKIEITSIQ